jgi:hypothetical protein
MANTNRNKGHDAERLYVNRFKEAGYEFCITSRYGSRIHDDAGIDLMNLPINVQVKAGKQRGLDYSKTLRDIAGRIATMFPPDAPEHNRDTIIIHKKEVGRGKKRDKYDELVIMTFEDYVEKIKKK